MNYVGIFLVIKFFLFMIKDIFWYLCFCIKVCLFVELMVGNVGEGGGGLCLGRYVFFD